MKYVQPIELNLVDELARDKEYRKAFFRAYSADAIALQIRELRKIRDMSQTDLAAACGMKQSAISRIEQADYSNWSYNTLWRVAEALRARLVVSFQTLEEAIREYDERDATSTSVDVGDIANVSQLGYVPNSAKDSQGSTTSSKQGSSWVKTEFTSMPSGNTNTNLSVLQ